MSVGRIGHWVSEHPSLCRNSALVRTTGGVVSAIFGSVELGDFFLWSPVMIKFVLWFAVGDGISGTRIAVCHFLPLPSVRDFDAPS